MKFSSFFNRLSRIHCPVAVIAFFCITVQAQEKRTYIEVDGLSATISESRYRQTFEEAKRQCESLDFKGGGGWRLPGREEIKAVNPYKHGELLPQPLTGWRVCDIRQWTSERDAEDKPLWYCESRHYQTLAFRQEFASYGTDGIAMCVRKGSPSAPIVAQEKPVTQTSAPRPMFSLTKMPDSPKDTGPTADQWAAWKRERTQDEERIAQENAQRAQNVAARELRERQQCMAPGMRGMCSCTKYFPGPKGNSCGK